jgi:hypothetical protein
MKGMALAGPRAVSLDARLSSVSSVGGLVDAGVRVENRLTNRFIRAVVAGNGSKQDEAASSGR